MAGAAGTTRASDVDAFTHLPLVSKPQKLCVSSDGMLEYKTVI